jgi:hypothetical protein
MSDTRAAFRPPLPWVAVAAAAATAGLLGTIAADSRWLVALGRAIVRAGHVPDGVPFATAPTSGWPNVPVAGELVLDAFDRVGTRGLLLLQVVAVAASLAIVARDMREADAGERGAFWALLLIVPASFAAVVAVRAQLFSLVLFPLLALLVRREARAPSRRVWLLVPLVALWSNLHGGVLTGLAVAGAYLVVDRLRREPGTALGVLAACGVALCLTPALWNTPAYYAGVLGNEAARQGAGLWAPLSLSGLDLLLVAGALVLIAGALRSRPTAWELVVIAGLAFLTVRAARGGVFLVLFTAVPAACGFGGPRTSRPRVAGPVVVAFAVLALFGIVRGPILTGASDALVARTVRLAAGTPVLAEDQLAEQVALAGGRIWVGNPIDAFRRADQRLYIDWIRGVPAGDRALDRAPRAVLVRSGSDAQRRLARDRGWQRVAGDARVDLYARRN